MHDVIERLAAADPEQRYAAEPAGAPAGLLVAIVDGTQIVRRDIHTSEAEVRRLVPVTAIAAAVVVIVGLVSVVLLSGGGSTEGASVRESSSPGSTGGVSATTTEGGLGTQVPGPGIDPVILDLLPAGFDVTQAIGVYTAEGSAFEVASGYLDSRLPDAASLGVVVSSVEEVDGVVLARWAWGQQLDPATTDLGQGSAGWVLLRPTGSGFEVVAATTDGVDLSGVAYRGERVSGTITGPEGLGADILTLEGVPVAAAPYPDGFSPDADYLWGSSGASNESPLIIDVGPVSGPVIVRVHVVGGTLLSVSEVLMSPDTVGAGTESDLTSLMPRVVIDLPGFAIVDGSESQDGGNFHGEWLIQLGEVSGRITLDSDQNTPSHTFDEYGDLIFVTVIDVPGRLGVNDEGFVIEWELDDRMTLEIDGTAIDPIAVAEAIRYVDETTWRELLPNDSRTP